MMEMERRAEPKRMPIEKPIALFVPGRPSPYRGTTSNMSDAGICADFSRLPQDGTDVLLHVYWQEDKPPIEQHATLAWRDAEAGGGNVQVGLRLCEGPSESAAAPLPAAEPARTEPQREEPPRNQILPSACPVIEQGGTVHLLMGGVSVEATAASVGEINEDNTVEVVLEITDPAFTGAPATESAIPPEAEDWTPHPFRDARRSVTRLLGPPARFTWKYARIAARTVARTASALIRKIKAGSPRKLSA